MSVPHSSLVKTTRESRDVFTGTLDELIAADLVTREQVAPQLGRAPGHTAFLPSGEPCPTNLRAWRDPGYKSIRQQPDGTFKVEITVARDVQAWRRKSNNVAANERERQRVAEDLADGRYANWRFKQIFEGWAEIWHGTKAQFHEAGLGRGLAFPNEAGAPAKLRCKCALGFEFVISQSHYDHAQAAAGIFYAHSPYVARRGGRPKEFEDFAPGVKREVWTEYSWAHSRDSYFGTAQALVDAGLAPGVHLFPGQPGATKIRASYRDGWRPADTSNRQGIKVTIQKLGPGRFSLEVPVTEAEEARRRQLSKDKEEQDALKCEPLAAERRKLRQGADPEQTLEDFHHKRYIMVEVWLNSLQNELFGKVDGMSLDLPDEEITTALEQIRKLVECAGVRSEARPRVVKRPQLTIIAGRR